MLREALITPSSLEITQTKEQGSKLTSLLGIAQIISWGTLYYSYPLIAEAMSKDFGFSKSEIYGAATIGLLTSALCAYPIGRAIDQGRGRRIMVSGALFAGALLMILSQITSLITFYAIVMFLGIAQAMTLYEATFAVIARHTTKARVSRSITTVTLWGGFASTAFIPLVELLIRKIGWSNSLIVLGIFNFVVAAIYYLSIPKLKTAAGVSEIIDSWHLNRQSFKFLLRSEVFWGLLISFVCYSLIFSGITFHLFALFTSRNLTPSAVAFGMAILGPAQVLGRIMIWRFSKNTSVANWGRYVLFAFPVSILTILFSSPLIALITFMLIYGIANGIMTIIRGTAVPEMITADHYGSINSFISVPSTICKALGPFALAYSFQVFGSYTTPLVAILFVTVVILISYWYATLKVKVVRAELV